MEAKLRVIHFLLMYYACVISSRFIAQAITWKAKGTKTISASEVFFFIFVGMNTFILKFSAENNNHLFLSLFIENVLDKRASSIKIQRLQNLHRFDPISSKYFKLECIKYYSKIIFQTYLMIINSSKKLNVASLLKRIWYLFMH